MFLGRLKKTRPGLAVFIIPGNHDSPERLTFGRKLFSELGFYFAADIEDAFTPVMIKDTAVFQLPFMTADNIKKAAGELEEARRTAVQNGAKFTVLSAHLFSAGGVESDSERTFIGTAEKVDINLFSGFDYAALGHLHRFQKAGKNAWYSGSPLAYSFDETEGRSTSNGAGGAAAGTKFFLSVELGGGGGGKTITPVPLEITPLHRMRRLHGDFDYFYGCKEDVLQDAQNDYLEINLSGSSLVTQPAMLLSQHYPHILRITQEAAFAALSDARKTGRLLIEGAAHDEAGGIDGGRALSAGFASFLADLYGVDAGSGVDAALAEKQKLFDNLLAEIEKEEKEA
jgi:exonuclease SbcD